MKKILITIFFVISLMCNVQAETISSGNINSLSYVIGKYLFTREVSEGYNGKLTTQMIMIAAQSIESDNVDDMIIYYKKSNGDWINALNGSGVEVPSSFDIEVINMNNVLNNNYETVDLTDYQIATDDIYNLTYVIGNHMFTRDTNANDKYNGKLDTKKIMLAAKTIKSNNKEDMIIYYKKSNGSWISALTGTPIDVPTTFEIETINLRNQVTNPYIAVLDTGAKINVKLKKLAGNDSATYSSLDENIVEIKAADSLPSNMDMLDVNTLSSYYSDLYVYAWYDNGTIYYYSKDFYHNNVNINLDPNSSYLFYRLGNVQNIELDHISTSNVTNMEYMFANSPKLENIDLTKFDTSNVTSMYGMFNEDTGLKSVDLTHFTTTSLTDIAYMFYRCESIKSLDLSSLNLSNVTTYNNAFYAMNLLGELTTPKVNSQYTLMLPKTMYDSNNNQYTALSETTPTQIVLRVPVSTMKGQVFNARIKTLAGNSNATQTTEDTLIREIRRATSLPNIELTDDNLLTNGSSNEGLYVWYDNGIIYYYSAASKIYLDSEATYMFANLSKVESIDLSIFDTSSVQYMSYMFYNCGSLTSLDLSNFNLSLVSNATSTFEGDGSLKTLKTPGKNANIDILLSKAMYDSNGNEYTKLTNALTSSVTLETKTQLVTGQTFNTKIKKLAGNTMGSYIYSDQNITAFRRANSLANIEFTDDNIISLNDSRYPVYIWFDNGTIYYYTEASRIYLNNASAYMFSGLMKIEVIELSDFDTSFVTKIQNMFYGCSSLTSLDLSSFNLSKVTGVDGALANMTSLVELTTPKVNANTNISLPITMYDSTNNEYSALTSNSPTNTLLKTEW